MDDLFVSCCIVLLFAFSSHLGIGYAQITFNVIDYGAVGDGITDDSNAFMKAWGGFCEAATSVPTLQFPQGKTFLLSQPINFNGPCKSTSLHVQVSGKLVAPSTIEAWKGCASNVWLSFSNVNNLIVDGSGQIDGQGSAWWNKVPEYSDIIINVTDGSCIRPKALHFDKCDNLQLRGLTHINSPQAHIGIGNSNGVTVSNLNISAPGDSPNTDGIDIRGSSNVNIHDSIIATGDDCIAINGGSISINITNIACGPGHGISVGSLGAYGAYDTVEDVHVYNCSFIGTQNGARIKTWQGGSGYARKIQFQKITLIATQNPIIIDQYYCNGQSGCKNETSGVKVSDVTYVGFEGTSDTEEAITFACCKSNGCSNIIMNEVNITSSVPGKTVYAFCDSVQGSSQSSVPIVPCLSS